MTDHSVPDYDDFYDGFDAASFQATFGGGNTDGLNVCVECCDRHASGDKIALAWESADGTSGTVTFADLKTQSARFANLLVENRIGPGDRVAGLLPRIPELLCVLFGTLRAGAVYQPLFTAFGPKTIEQRLEGSQAKLIVTDTVNRPKLDDISNRPLVMTIGKAPDGDISFHAALDRQPGTFKPVLCCPEDPFLMMFTSGTTGPPKGVNVPIAALPAFAAYLKYGVDLRPDDKFWNVGDPGWAYGLFHGAIGPLQLGYPTMLVDGAFTVERTCEIIRKHGITNFTGTPTAYRLMVAAGNMVRSAIRGQLRVASSAGEHLNPEVVRWFDEELQCTLHNQYGQTEVAMILLNHHGLKHAVRVGSAGRAMPGYSLAVVDEAGNPLANGEPGILAIDRVRSPLFWFAGYAGREGLDWVGDYYLTGDAAKRHEDGSYSLLGRGDDVISSAGYRIGPFDVESCLIEHASVMESAVVGKPDEERGQIVKAVIVLNGGFEASDALSETLRLHVRNRLGAHAYPREISFVGSLPKTPSGKVQRFLLRE
jgi:acetyl-CoA synthetase